MSKPQPPNGRVSPDYQRCPSNVPCPLPRWTERVQVSIASPFARPSPYSRRIGVHIFTFEACSDFTRVTARRIAQPPKAAFVTRLRPSQSPSQAARQLPDQSTTLWVEPTSTGNAPSGRTGIAGNSRLFASEGPNPASRRSEPRGRRRRALVKPALTLAL